MSEDAATKSVESMPAPEVLTTVSSPGETVAGADTSHAVESVATVTPRRRIAYRPSHKATFIGLAVISAILAANAVIISLVMRNQVAADDAAAKNSVSINTATLDKLGVSRDPVGGASTELVVGPNSTFNGRVKMGGDLQVAGQFVLNSKLTATDAALAKLQAGDTQVQQLNVNGDSTISTLNLRKDLKVAGSAQIQGQLTVNQLATINNNMNVAGNLSIGGTLSVRNFQVANLTVAGHLNSSGALPTAAAGGGTGTGGTASISGNDTSGTVSVNTGVGAGNGLLATVTFTTKYDATPHVVVTPVGRSVPGMYINRTSAGFSISVDGAMSPGGYAFDYVVVQ